MPLEFCSGSSCLLQVSWTVNFPPAFQHLGVYIKIFGPLWIDFCPVWKIWIYFVLLQVATQFCQYQFLNRLTLVHCMFEPLCQNSSGHSCVGSSLILYPVPLVCLFLCQYRTVFINALGSGIGTSICVLSPECTKLNVYFVLVTFLVQSGKFQYDISLHVNTMHFSGILYSVTNRFSHIPSLFPFLFPIFFKPYMYGCDYTYIHIYVYIHLHIQIKILQRKENL